MEKEITKVENENVNVLGKVFTKNDLMKQLSNYLAKDHPDGYSINMECIDNLIRFETGKVCIITGLPGSGKSEILNFFNIHLNELYGWRSIYYSPENHPIGVYLLQKLLCCRRNEGIDLIDMVNSIYETDIDCIMDNFYFLNYEILDEIDTVLSEAQVLINKDEKIKVLNLDPFNGFEHKYTGTETQYVGEFLNKLRKFAQKNDILINLIAHPTKLKENEKITGNTIYGSYNFFAKSDYAYSINRHFDSDIVDFETLKIKQKNLGSIGKCQLRYDWKSGNYYNADSETNEVLDSLDTVNVSEEMTEKQKMGKLIKKYINNKDI